MEPATTAAASSGIDLPTSPPRGQRAPREDLRSSRRGGGGGGTAQRGRGGSNASEHAPRGRGRGGRQRRDTQGATAGPSSAAGVPPATQPVQASVVSTTAASGDATPEGEEDVEAEVCFICASPVIHNSIAPCNHRTCHICALRMRALYKTKACAHCRSESQFVIFTDDANKRFEDFSEGDFAKSDAGLGIKYEKNEIFEDTVLLLRYNCPEETCDMACYGWDDLQRHVKNAHHKLLCNLCTRNKKVFTHEHELFTKASLDSHAKFGDDNPGAIDQSGFKGHPECGFCKQRFYGDDELYTHCRDKHERCHVCDRRSANSDSNSNRKQQYYLNYDALETHFRKDHFLCPDSECMEKKFVVFESEMDLKAHQLEAHPHGLSKDARRDARRVDMSGFDYRQPHQEPQRGGRREGRGRGRGRDPNVDSAPIPASSAQPLRRDELAYQRSLAIHTAQSVSNRTFGGQLSAPSASSTDAFAARGPSTNPPTVTAPAGSSSSSSRPSAPSTQPPPLSSLSLLEHQTPADRARAVRHTHLLERASALLHNNQTSLQTFRQCISSYRTSAQTAAQTIDALLSLFSAADVAAVGTLMKELADLFEVPGKRDDLLKAWNDWRAINDAEDYPSLPAGAPSSSSSSLVGGKRLLKLKSSTAQSSRSAVGRQGSWGGGAGFPALAAPSASAARHGASSSSWGNSAAASGTATPNKAPVSSRPAQPLHNRVPAPAATADMFPALPAAQKPGMSVMRPGAVGTPRIMRGSGTGTPVSVWGASAAPGGLGAAVEAALQEQESEGKGKGKGRKKVVLNWAA